MVIHVTGHEVVTWLTAQEIARCCPAPPIQALTEVLPWVPQVNCEALPPGPSNPWGNAFVARETPLCSVKAAQREVNPFTSRVWMFTNPNVGA